MPLYPVIQQFVFIPIFDIWRKEERERAVAVMSVYLRLEKYGA